MFRTFKGLAVALARVGFCIERKSGGHKPAGCPTKRLSRRITGGLMPAALVLVCLFSCTALAQTPITITEQDIYDGLDIGNAWPPTIPDYPSGTYEHSTGRIALDDTGGYIYLWGWDGLIFRNNTTTLNGGAFFIGNGEYDFSSEVTLGFAGGSPPIPQRGLWFMDNSAVDGGAIFLDGGELTIGQRYSDADLFPPGSLPIPTAAEFRGNSASGDGGAIFNNGGILTLNGVNFYDNTAGGRGSAIYNAGGVVNINTSGFDTNGAKVIMSGSGPGAIIYNDGGEININVGQGGFDGALSIAGGLGTESIRFAGNSSLNLTGLGVIGYFPPYNEYPLPVFAPMSAEAGANVTINTTAAAWSLWGASHDLSAADTVDFTVGGPGWPNPDSWYRVRLGLGTQTVLNLGSGGTFTLGSGAWLDSLVYGPSSPGYDGVTIITDTFHIEGNNSHDIALQFTVGINEAILTIDANHFTGRKIGGNSAVLVDWWGGGGLPNKTLVNGETWILADTGTPGTTANSARFFFADWDYQAIHSQPAFTNYVPWRGSTGGYSGITLGLATNADQSQLLLKAVDSTAYSDALYWTGWNTIIGENSVWAVDNTWIPFTTQYPLVGGPERMFYGYFSNDNSNWFGEIGGDATSSGIMVPWFLNGTGTDGDHVIFADTIISSGEVVATIDNKEVIVSHGILGAGPIVRSMEVTGTDYVFDITAGGNILTAVGKSGVGGNIDFGTATLLTAFHASGTTIQAAGAITFNAGSGLELDTTGADGVNAILTLDATSVTLNSNIYLNSLLSTLSDGFVLVDVGTSAVVNPGMLYEHDGTEYQLYTAERSDNPSDKMYGLALVGDKLVLEEISAAGNSTDLTWKGTAALNEWNNTSANWQGMVNDIQVKTFLNGDTVTFDNTAANKNVTVASGGVSVDSMDVTGTGYTFNMTVGASPAIAATGNINLGSATLNITGYTPGNPNPYTTSVSPQTIVSAGGTLTGFNSAVTVVNQASVDFLAASAFQEGNAIKVETRLTWDSTDPNRKAHGDFTIASDTFTLGAVLGDNSASTNRRSDWDGNSLTKLGAGTLFLNGANTYTGDTTVAAGTLGGNGSIASNLVINGGATFSPGNSIGTFTVNNKNVTFKTGATYLYEIDKTAVGQKSDLLIVNNGMVTIEPNAQLKIVFLGGTGADDDEFQVIRASSFADATLFTLVDTWATSFSQEIRSTGYWISWIGKTPNFVDAVKGYGTPNAINAAAGMDGIFDIDRTGDVAELYDALAGMDASKPKDLADAFAQLHGEVFASNKEAAAQLQRRFLRQLPSAQNRLLCDGLCIGEWHRWATFTGEYLGRKKIGAYSGYDLRTAGVAVGVDRHITTNMIFGGAFGYDNAFQDFRTIRSHNQMDVFRSALYGGWWNGNTFVDGYVGYTKNWHKTRRDVNIGAFNASARSKYDDDMFSTGFEIGREYGSLTPSFGLHYVHLSAPSVTETGGGDASLHVYGSNYQSLRMPVGAKWSRNIVDNAGPDIDMVWTPEVRAFYVRELADDSARVRTSFDGVREVSFGAESGKWGQDSCRLGAGLEMRLTSRLNVVNVRIDYDYEVYNHTAADMFATTLGVSW